MKVGDFIGMKVIDIGAKDVGKVEDVTVSLKESLFNQIFISTGSPLKKKFFTVQKEDLAAIGDFVQLKLDENELENRVKVDKIDDAVAKESRFKNIEGKVVLAKGGMEIGKVEDIIIDLEAGLIKNVIISMGGTFSRKRVMITTENIAEIGDYIILNISQEQIKEMVMD